MQVVRIVCPAVVQAVIFLSLYLITGRKNILAGLVITITINGPIVSTQIQSHERA